MNDAPDRRLPWKIAGLSAAMFAFGFFVLPPLYETFCEITGFGGRTAAAASTEVARPDPSRTVRVEFLSSVASGAPFTLEPQVSHLDVYPGQLYETHYRAHNLTGSRLVGQAVPSVAPGAVARHFLKTECFCFTSQEFQPHEELTLKLAFIVAPELPAHVDTLSLSYAYFSAAK
ncbi:MAG TPA: cytochrome c oxidase assembly protein [Gammaproteobacteria bacterium]|nr:cytochrome c oxidase assembly protein [Gammaproteobacteria bacterium]